MADRRQSIEERERSATHALHAYRERRLRRRADDTYFGSVDALLAEAEAEIGEVERERRRCDILADAEEIGMPAELAEKLYEVAREEGLDPGLAFELVATGLAVCPPDQGISNASSAPVTDRYLPEWIFPAVATDDLLRERTLRFSFRRLRALLETHPKVEDAFRAFAREPDVGHCGY